MKQPVLQIGEMIDTDNIVFLFKESAGTSYVFPFWTGQRFNNIGMRKVFLVLKACFI